MRSAPRHPGSCSCSSNRSGETPRRRSLLRAVLIEKQGRADEPLIVLPADHLIQDEARFAAVAANAAKLAAAGRIVLFGIQPTLPETGFGYIECSAIPVGDAPQSVRRFVEKPSPEKATEYLAAGNYLWNSGMFCFTAGTMLDALKRHAPAVLEAARMASNADRRRRSSRRGCSSTARCSSRRRTSRSTTP